MIYSFFILLYFPTRYKARNFHKNVKYSKILTTITDKSTGAIQSIGLFGKSINTLTKNIASIKAKGLITSLFSTSTIDTNAVNYYNKAIKEAIANGTTIVERQQIMQSAMENTNKVTAQLIGTTNGAKVETTALAAAQKQSTLAARAHAAALKALSVAGNMSLSLGISVAIGALMSGLDYLIHKEEKDAEALENAKNKFSQTTEEVQKLNDKLKTTQSKIKELQKLAADGTITIVQENQLKILKETNDELQRKRALEQKEQIDDAKEYLENAQKANKDRKYSYAHYNTEGKFVIKHAHGDASDQLQDTIVHYQDALKYFGEASVNQERCNEVISDLAKPVNNLVKAYQALEDAGIKLTKEQQAEYSSALKAQDAYLLYSYNINKTKEGFQALNEEQQLSIIHNKLLEQGLTNAQANSVLKYLSKDDLDNYYDFDFDFPLPNPNDFKTAEEYGKAYAEAWKKGVKDSADNNSDTGQVSNNEPHEIGNDINSEHNKIISFNKAWKDTADETKQELLELARAGEISEETLESTEKYSHLLSETGMSAKRVKDNITDMLTTQEKLSAFSNGMSSLQSAYQEFQDKKFVTASTLEGLPNVLKQMNGGKDFDLFSRIAGDPSSGSQKIKKAFDDIITAYLKNQNTLVGVTQKTKSAVIANLKDAGVSNAAEIVNSYINNVNRGKAIMAQAAAELENKSNAKRQADLNNFQELLLKKDISFAEACNALGGKNAALMQLLGVQYSEDYIKWTQLLSDKISAYNRMVDAINAAGVADDFSNAPYASARAAFEAKYKMSPEEYAAKNNPLNKPFLQRVKQDKDYELAMSIIQNEKAAKEEQKQRDKMLNKLNRAKPVDFNGITYNGSSSGDKDGKAQQEKSYQLIDWIARKLETLQSKIDLTKAKFENLFALKSKKDNLSTQIKQTTKLLHKQEKAAKKYQKIANKYAKTNKINKKTIKQVKNGSLNIKKYESNIAEIIQTYQDYYDKAKAAEKAAIEAKKAIRELKKERNQLYIDRADSKLSAIDAQVENQKTVKGKNKYLQKKIEWIKEYYYYQIKNAELEKNETKAAEFRAQRKKARRDLEIQQHQNRADDREAHFNLNQKRAENATNAKDKNKYEETSLQNLQDQYRWKAEIARLEHGEKSAEYKLVKEEEKSEIRAAYKRMYDNIKSEYDNLTSLNDAQIATVQAKIATLEAAGKSASKEMYLEMMKISSDTEEKLINKRAELAESGKNLEAGSDEWYTWKDDMESIEQSLYSCKQNTIEWQKAVNELDLKKFSLMAAQLDATKNHLDFLVGMLSHQDLTSKESGGLTDAGFPVILIP